MFLISRKYNVRALSPSDLQVVVWTDHPYEAMMFSLRSDVRFSLTAPGFDVNIVKVPGTLRHLILGGECTSLILDG